MISCQFNIQAAAPVIPFATVVVPDSCQSNPYQLHIARFDQVDRIYTALHGVVGERIRAQSLLASKQAEVDSSMAIASEVAEKVRTVEKRLARNKNPNLLRYLQINRQGKIRRLELELDKLRTREQANRTVSAQLERELGAAKHDLMLRQTNEREWLAAEQERKQLIDVVAAGNLTPTLTILIDKRHAFKQQHDTYLRMETPMRTLKDELCLAVAAFDEVRRNLLVATRISKPALLVKLDTAKQNAEKGVERIHRALSLMSPAVREHFPAWSSALLALRFGNVLTKWTDSLLSDSKIEKNLETLNFTIYSILASMHDTSILLSNTITTYKEHFNAEHKHADSLVDKEKLSILHQVKRNFVNIVY